MKGIREMQVRLPEGARTTEEDLELLESAFRAIAALHYESGRECRKCVKAMEAEGWKVHMELVWRAVATKGHEYEESAGRTRVEALAGLRQLTGLDAVQGCP